MPQITKINTVRHAKTYYSMDHRYAGSIDVPLSDQGIQDARDMAKQLSEIKFDAVITSTLNRTIKTAELLTSRNGHFEQNELCNERNFGAMEGLTWNEVQNLDPPVLFIEVGNDLHSVNPRGGEAFEDVWRRARKFHRYLFNEHKGSNILIVSHGVFLQLFHGLLRGLSCIESLSKPYPSTLDLTTFHFSDNDLVFEETIKFAKVEEKSF